jgi:hypothetical protein
MAKKTGKNDAKAQQTTIARYALERAGKAVSALGEIELAPGSYPFALDVSITGELLVEAGSDGCAGKPAKLGPPAIVPSFSPNDVLVGLIASIPAEKREEVISNAVGAWKSASEEQRAAYAVEAGGVCLKVAKRRKLTTEVETVIEPAVPGTNGRKGAIKCKPSVRITGSAGSQVVEVEVAA